jgi:DNA-binding transcriptional ArsR family regulator
VNRHILGLEDLTPAAKLVWLYVDENYASVADEPVQLSQSTIGLRLGMSRRSVMRAMRLLQQRGLLHAERKPRSRETYTFVPRLPRARTITVQRTVAVPQIAA